MKNYISINGKKIELSDETVKNITSEITVDIIHQVFHHQLIKEDKFFDIGALSIDGRYLFSAKQAREAGFLTKDFMQVRCNGGMGGNAFFLSSKYNWELERDFSNVLCLIPTKK